MRSKSEERIQLLNNGLQKKSNSTSTKAEVLPFFKLFTYSSSVEKIAILFGTLFNILAGIAFSFFSISLGNVTSVIVTYVQSTSNNVTADEKEKDQEDLYDGAIEFVIVNVSLATVIMVCIFLGNFIFNYTAYRQTYKIKNLFLASVLNQDISWHDVNQTGEFSTRITEDMKKLEEGIGEKVAMFMYFFTVFFFSLVQAFNLGWELSIISMLSLPLSALGMVFVSYASTKLALKETDAYGEAGALAEEVFTSLRTVVAFGGEKVEARSYDILLKFARDNNIKRALFTGLGEAITWLLLFSNYGLSYWYGVNLIIRDRAVPPNEVIYDAGSAVSIFFSVFSAVFYFSMLSTYLEIFSVAKSAASKIYPMIENKPVINLSKGNGKRYSKVEGKIEFKNVHFEYPSRTDVKILRGLDLVINPGETVALVGSSGCGKSTCIQLIQRYYDPTFGYVFIDGHKLQDLDLTWFRNWVGVVGQEPVLFEASIIENIRMGCKSASIQEVEQAAKKANAHGFIRALPQGYDTLVGERGTQLSGGQKQRIAIARALVRKPSILLLDEATSALDTSSEATVQAALEQASVECTTIIVAHRLSTVKKADRIVVISNGAVEEQGNHNELMAKKGLYYELVTAQVSEEEMVKDTDTLPPLIESQYDDSTRKDSVELEPRKRSSQLAAFTKEIFKEQKGFFTLVGEVLKYNSPEWWAITIGCICSCLLGVSMPVYAVLYGNFIGTFADEDDEALLSQVEVYALMFVSIGVVLFLATVLQSYFFGLAGETLTMRLRSSMFKSLLNQEMAYFDNKNHSVGSICGLLAAEAASVQGATGLRIGVILSALATVVSALVISFYYEWRITLVVICFSPVIILVTVSENKIIVTESHDIIGSLQTSTKIAVEAINGIRTVVSLGCEDFFHKAYMAEIAPVQKLALKNTHIRGLVYSVNRTAMLFAYAAAFYYGITLIGEEGIEYSTMYIVTLAVITSSAALAKGFVFTPNLQKGLISAGRIIDLVRRQTLVTSGPRDPYEKWNTPNVKYDNVHFSYPTRSKVKVLTGLNLSVEQGQTVALVGPSGCGKSTIVQLLERFYDPVLGTISVGNVPINTMHLSSLRSQLGIVSQEPNLFNRTIADNIAYGDNSRFVTDYEIIEAAKNANIHDFVVSLPLGYSTKLGDKGTQLSGGQKQRVAIARALVRNPRILLLDEATSALDAESEKVVQEALDQARMGRTCITIAHRLSTIQDADVICVISRGAIAEIGTHQELLALRGLYYDLYRLQH